MDQRLARLRALGAPLLVCTLVLTSLCLALAPAGAQTEVPDVRGMFLTGAEQRLQSQGLRLGPVDYRIADHQPGTIFEQRPQPGQPADASGAVAVVVAEAPIVPDLLGQPLARAQALLLEHSLQLGELTRELATEPSGTIIGQRPGPGQRARFGAVVDVRVAESPSVPNLVGRATEDAERLLERQLLELREVEQRFSQEPPGTVLDQNPAPGSMAAAGDVVEVVTARALQIPDLRGLSREDAAAELATLGLELGDLSEVAAEAPPGTVIGQAPAAGARALPGDAVALQLARAPEVPDLRGLDRETAEAELARQMLALGEIGYEAALESPLTVVRQEPPAGTVAAAGASVDLVLAVTPPSPERPGLVVPEVAGEPFEETPEEVGTAGTVAEPDDPIDARELPDTAAVQDPPAGAVPPEAGPVPIRPDGVEQVSLPELEGLLLADAEPLLEEHLLEPARIAYLPARAHAGTIIDQRPPAGETVGPGARLELIVARPPQTPSLLGLSTEWAETVLASELLRLGSVENVFAVDWPGTIVEQVPPPGTRLAPDDVVHVKVAGLLAPVTLGSSLLLALLALTAVARRRPRPPTGEPRAIWRANGLRVVITPDPGLQEVEAPRGALVGAGLALRTRADVGRQSVELLPEGEADGADAPDR